jgi:hypothetical protein
MAQTKPTSSRGNRNADLIHMHFACVEAAVAVTEAQLGSPGSLANGFGLALLPYVHEATETGREALVPGRFDEHSPRVAW